MGLLYSVPALNWSWIQGEERPKRRERVFINLCFCVNLLISSLIPHAHEFSLKGQIAAVWGRWGIHSNQETTADQPYNSICSCTVQLLIVREKITLCRLPIMESSHFGSVLCLLSILSLAAPQGRVLSFAYVTSAVTIISRLCVWIFLCPYKSCWSVNLTSYQVPDKCQ